MGRDSGRIQGDNAFFSRISVSMCGVNANLVCVGLHIVPEDDRIGRHTVDVWPGGHRIRLNGFPLRRDGLRIDAVVAVVPTVRSRTVGVEDRIALVGVSIRGEDVALEADGVAIRPDGVRIAPDSARVGLVGVRVPLRKLDLASVRVIIASVSLRINGRKSPTAARVSRLRLRSGRERGSEAA